MPRATNVIDNLTYRREIPVMISVFINPSFTPEQKDATEAEWGDRINNRPQEYNALDDKYPRVIVDELLPVLYKDYNVSRDAEQHGIGGISSGGIAALLWPGSVPTIFARYSPLSAALPICVALAAEVPMPIKS